MNSQSQQNGLRQSKKRSKIDGKLIRDLFLIFLIFVVVRFVMLTTGVVFFNIPLLDACLWPIVKFVNDPNLKNNIDNWYMQFETKYLMGFFAQL